jgi:hypothetical protein
LRQCLLDVILVAVTTIHNLIIEYEGCCRVIDGEWPKVQTYEMITVIDVPHVSDEGFPHHLLAHFQGETDVVGIVMSGSGIIDVKFI